MSDIPFSVLLDSPWTYPTQSTRRLALPTMPLLTVNSSQVKATMKQWIGGPLGVFIFEMMCADHVFLVDSVDQGDVVQSIIHRK
jgi:hypothetical protein